MGRLTLANLRHPKYLEGYQDWHKWRLSYQGGRQFINSYLYQYGKRETTSDFENRKKMTYCPRFAGAAIDDVKNNIYHRMCDIRRIGGDVTYQEAITGKNGGVDREGSSMDMFIGQYILPELLTMAKVGVYVDMPAEIGPTLADNVSVRPYLYYYCAEDIQAWNGHYVNNCYHFTSLLLKDRETEYDPETNLPLMTRKIWCLFRLTPEGVKYTEYDHNDNVLRETLLQGMRRIPFVIFELNKSLMEDICDYQIALLNMESSDVNYSVKSNFPIYTQQYDPRSENSFIKPNTTQQADDPLKRTEAVVGPQAGIRYPVNTERPDFIYPSPEPLKASMAKEQQIKDDIRHLLNLNLGALEPKFASAESKGMDDRSLESGLSAIGKVLEHGENQILEIWNSYMSNKTESQVNYPRNYALKSEADRRQEAKTDSELLGVVPSRTYQKEIAKKIANNVVGHLISFEDLNKIFEEIDQANYITSDVVAIAQDLEYGLVSDKTASIARGYSPEEVEQAKKDRAERIRLTQMAQTSPNDLAARGLSSLDPEHGNRSAEEEKELSDGRTG